MSNFPRFTLNRTIVLLVPKLPFLEWLNDAEPAEQALTMEDLCEDNEAFLIPQLNDEQDSTRWVEKRWSILFEHMLEEWVVDETLWPQQRTLELFREWFDIEIHTLAWDLADEPLLIEDWHDEDAVEEYEFPEMRPKISLH
jgi:hypothetical protein